MSNYHYRQSNNHQNNAWAKSAYRGAIQFPWPGVGRVSLLLIAIFASATAAFCAEKPKIVKRGTIACDLVEATPIVFHDKLYRFEYVRKRYKPNTTSKTYFHFIDVETGKPTPGFATGHNLGCAFVDGDTVYVYGVKGWGTPTIYVFWSKDLKNWQSRAALKTDAWGIYNSSVCKDDKGYLMAFEVGSPKEVAGSRFTTRFARSKNLLDWKLLDEPAVYSKAFYTACPAIRFLDGYYYMFYLAARPGPKWETYLVRSRDLVHWERSPCNPILAFSPEDKQIANDKLTPEEREHIAKAENRNNSDFDLCEHGGKVIINYSWGNQHGKEFLAEAFYDGSMEQFLKGCFDKVVAEWRFDREGDFRGWQVGGHLKDVSVSGGALRGEASDWDPMIFGPIFEIAATPTQHIEIKMKCDAPSSGQLFWTNDVGGKFGGFSQDRCNNLEFRGDGRFHVYRIDPFWHAAGKIVRLRFDPPGTGRFAVEWIRIVEMGETAAWTTSASARQAWKFNEHTHGWHLRPGSGRASIVDGALRVVPRQKKNADNADGAKRGKGPLLTSPRLSLSAEENPFVCVRMAVSAEQADVSGRIMCVSKSRFGFSEATFPLRADGKMHTYNINMKPQRKWRDEIIMIALRLPHAADAEVRVESVEIGPRPSGPVELAVDYFGPAAGVNRAGRAAEVTCAVSNLGGQVARNVTMTLSVPPGVKIIGSAAQRIERISYYLAKQAAWSIEAPQPGPVEVSLKIEAPGTGSANTETATAKTTVHFTPAPRVAKSDHVPEPQPVESKYDVGVFYFPGWPSIDRWRPIFDFPMRKPLLGWYDEANPECVDWQIKWAVEHGVRFFMVDWYWNKGRRHLEHWLHDGFMKARHRRYLKWAVMWANHNPAGSHSKEDWRKVTQYWIDNYFGTHEYYKIDGRPAVFIWAPSNIRHDVGGSEKAAELYAMSQSMAKAAGHKGIYFAAMSSHASSGQCRQLEAEGYQAMTNYHGFQLAHEEAGSRRFPFADVVRTSPEVWRREDERSGGLAYMPIVETGWSSEPWHHGRALVVHDRTPELFGELCRKAREYADKNGKKIIALSPWNEWGEGSYIEPYAQYGFGDLDQLRAAFCEPGDYPPNLIPSDVGLGPYDLPRAPLHTSWGAGGKGSLKAWSGNGYLDIEVRDGAIVGRSTGPDPILQGPSVAIEAETAGRLFVRMKADKNDRAQMFWATTALPMGESTSAGFDVVGDGKFHDYKVDLSGRPGWSGLVVSLRLDPVCKKGTKFAIESIRVE